MKQGHHDRFFIVFTTLEYYYAFTGGQSDEDWVHCVQNDKSGEWLTVSWADSWRACDALGYDVFRGSLVGRIALRLRAIQQKKHARRPILTSVVCTIHYSQHGGR
jgi:hypothetical protein